MNTYKVTLAQDERNQLTEITRTGTHAARKVIHALILLNVDRGWLNFGLQTVFHTKRFAGR